MPLIKLLPIPLLFLLSSCAEESALTGFPPHIHIYGKMEDTVSVNSIYRDETAEADGCHEVTITGSVNTAVPGIYHIDYDYTDPAGNKAATVTRTVHVIVSNKDSLAIQSALQLYNTIGIAKHWRSNTQPTKEIALILNIEADFYLEFSEAGVKNSYKVKDVTSMPDALVFNTVQLISDSTYTWQFKRWTQAQGAWSLQNPQSKYSKRLGMFTANEK